MSTVEIIELVLGGSSLAALAKFWKPITQTIKSFYVNAEKVKILSAENEDLREKVEFYRAKWFIAKGKLESTKFYLHSYGTNKTKKDEE